jgi:hypothetical protein
MLLRTATGMVICPFVVILATSIVTPPYIPYSYYVFARAVIQAEIRKALACLVGDLWFVCPYCGNGSIPIIGSVTKWFSDIFD